MASVPSPADLPDEAVHTDTSGDRDFTLRAAKATAAALAVAGLAFAVWEVRTVLILLLLALTLAAAIRPGVEWLGRHRVPESVAILLHFLVVGGAIALFVRLAVPPALHQIGHALDTPPAHATGVRERLLIWLQQHLHELPTGTQLLHPVASYGHRAGEAVVAIFFTSPPPGTASRSANPSSSCSPRSHRSRSAR